MANTVVPEIAQSNAQFNIAQPVKKEITTDILNDGVQMYLIKNGIVNTSASELKGDTAYFYNINRPDTAGKSEHDDSYSNAQRRKFGYRELKMDKMKESWAISKKNTMDAVRAGTSIGALDQKLQEDMTSWCRNMLRTSLILHAAGTVSNSITQYDVKSSGAITDATGLANIRGHNTVEALHSDYVDYGNSNAGSPANPTAVTSANRVTLLDFMLKEQKLMGAQQDRTRFQGCDIAKCGFAFLHVIPHSFWLDMMTYAPTANSYSNIAYENYQRLAGGGANKEKEAGMVDGAFKLYDSIFTPYSRYLVLPDHMLPRATHGNAEVANTRVGLTLGKGAIDFKTGNAVTGDNSTTLFNIEIDQVTNKLNGLDVYQIEAMHGTKRARVFGTGALDSTRIELAASTLIGYTNT